MKNVSVKTEKKGSKEDQSKFLAEIADKLKDRELFPKKNASARETLRKVRFVGNK